MDFSNFQFLLTSALGLRILYVIYVIYKYFRQYKCLIVYTTCNNVKISILTYYDNIVFNLYLLEDRIIICSQKSRILHTGITVKISRGYSGRLESISNNVYHHKVRVIDKIIDSEHEEKIKIKLYNFSESNVIFYKDDCIAQLVIKSI